MLSVVLCKCSTFDNWIRKSNDFLKNSITLIITSIRLLLEEDDDDTEIKTKDDENRNETIVQIENVSQPTLTEIDPNNELKLDIDY